MRSVAAFVLFVLLSGCVGGGETVEGETVEGETVEGVLIDLAGDLTGVDSFVIRTSEGADLAFVPSSTALFDGGPLTHLGDHLRSGEPIEVVYETLEDGTLRAVEVRDAGR